MRQAYANNKIIDKSYLSPCFSPLKRILSWLFICCFFHSGLNAQVWFKEYSFAGTDHLIYDVTKFSNDGFSILFKEDNTDIFIGVDNNSGNTTVIETWGGSSEDVIGGGGGVIKVGLNGDSLQVVNLIKTANVTFVQWLKNFPPPTEFTFYGTPVSIIQLSAGGYIILTSVGANAPFATGNLLTRINGNGDMIWQKNISGVGRASIPFGIYASTDNNFFIHSLAALGSSNAGHYIHKVDDQGNILWTQGPEQDPNPPGTIFYSYKNLVPTPDGGIVFREGIGLSQKRDKKLNSDGSITWAKPNYLGRLIQLVGDKLVTYETVQDFNEPSYELKIAEINDSGGPINDQSIISTFNESIRLLTKFIIKNNDGSYTLIGNSSSNLNPPHKPDKLFALRTTVPPSVPSCADAAIEGGAGQINITGLTAPIEIVEVYDQNWQQIFRCQGTDCGSEQTLTNLNEGKYYVKVQFFNAKWQSICRLDNVEVIVGGGMGCNNPDYPAMAAFANTLIDQSNTINWDPDDCDICNWTGVTCNAAGRVEKIELSGRPLRGTLASEIGQLSELKVFVIESVVDLEGSIPTEITNLTNLETLSIVTLLEAPLGLKGGIPEGIGNLRRLKSLTIKGNIFSESIPASIGNLTKLEMLDLSYNRMPGSIPASIGNLTKLKTLALQHNNLTGDLPKELGDLSQLKKLILGQSFSTGSFFSSV